MKEVTVQATVEALVDILAFVEGELEAADAPMKVTMQMAIAVEEIYINIAHYAYAPEVGNATIRCEIQKAPPKILLQFQDSGIPFNPLEKEDADITLSAEERKIGGLGILMVKKTMDAMTYRYEDGKNILTIEKSLV